MQILHFGIGSALSGSIGSVVWLLGTVVCFGETEGLFCPFLQLKVPAGDVVPHVHCVPTLFVYSVTQLTNSELLLKILFPSTL